MGAIDTSQIEDLESILEKMEQGNMQCSDIQKVLGSVVEGIMALDLGSFAGKHDKIQVARDVRGANVLLHLARKKPNGVTSEKVRNLVASIGDNGDPIDALLTRAINAGVQILHKNIQKTNVRIFASSGQPILPANGGGKNERTSAPKFDCVMGILLKNAISYDSQIPEETLSQNDLRTFPYRVIHLTEKNKTLCVSDEVGQATYVFEGILDMEMLSKTPKSQGTAVIWSHICTFEKTLLSALESANPKGDKPEEFGELESWAREILYSSAEELRKIGICFDVAMGEWDLSKALGNTYWIKIGGVKLGSFPSGQWLTWKGIGKKYGQTATNVFHNIAELREVLTKLGEKVKPSENDLTYFPTKARSNPHYEEEYKVKARKCLEDNAGVLSGVQAIYTAPNSWNIEKMRGFQDWPKISGKNLNNFPSRGWSVKFLKQPSLNGVKDFGRALVILGYDVIQAPDNELDYTFSGEETDREAYDQQYREKARAMLRKPENLKKLGESGIVFKDGQQAWDIDGAKGNTGWPEINGKNFKYFPSADWNGSKLGIQKGIISNRIQIADMLTSLGEKVLPYTVRKGIGSPKPRVKQEGSS